MGRCVTERRLRVAIVGGDAMGSIYASPLSQSEHDVWLIDTWREHIEAIRHDGLRVEGPSNNTRRLTAINATRDVSDAGEVDLAILAVNAFATELGAASIDRVLVDGGIAISLQNGLGNTERLAAVASRAPVVVGVPGHGGAVLGRSTSRGASRWCDVVHWVAA